MQGGEVSQFYDPMIAKLIVHEAAREAAAARLADACREVEVWPVKTNAGFMARCLDHPRFVEGDVDTGFIAAEESALIAASASEAVLAGAAALLDGLARDDDRAFWGSGPFDPWTPTPDGIFGFRANSSPGAKVRVYSADAASDFVFSSRPDWIWNVSAGATSLVTDVQWGRRGKGASVMFDGRPAASIISVEDDVVVFRAGEVSRVSLCRPTTATVGAASDGGLRAPMPGKIVAAPAKAGDAVTKGQPVVVLEAMKMEHALTAPFDGVVAEFNVAVGDQVVDGAVLAVVKAAD